MRQQLAHIIQRTIPHIPVLRSIGALKGSEKDGYEIDPTYPRTIDNGI